MYCGSGLVNSMGYMVHTSMFTVQNIVHMCMCAHIYGFPQLCFLVNAHPTNS